MTEKESAVSLNIHTYIYHPVAYLVPKIHAARFWCSRPKKCKSASTLLKRWQFCHYAVLQTWNSAPMPNFIPLLLPHNSQLPITDLQFLKLQLNSSQPSSEGRTGRHYLRTFRVRLFSVQRLIVIIIINIVPSCIPTPISSFLLQGTKI